MSNKVIAGRYELLEKIGDGGMAVVYKAKCRLLNRFVALKILKPEFTRDAKFIENFRKESHAAAGLSHPNIVNIYDVGREGNINYIVMELVEGKTLSAIIHEEAPMPYSRVIEISRQIASGLAVAHKNGIIHRDIKPHNILINEDGSAKIADFGIAKAASTTTIIDGTGETIMGSVHYFSPEQARGGYVDEKTDIYSLGIVMYEMLTGKVPFDGDNPVTVALMHINESVPSPSTIADGIPPQLDKIVMKATEKYQSNRFKSAEEVIEALNNIDFVTRMVGSDSYTRVIPTTDIRSAELRREGEALDGSQNREDIKPKKKQKKFKNRRKRLIIIGIVIVILIGGGTALAMTLFKGNITVPDVRGMTFQEAEKELKKADLKIAEGKKVYSSKYKIDKITSQDPKEKTKAQKGSTVTVDISKGPKEDTAPNLIGLSEKEARERIKKYGFKVGDVQTVRDVKPKGTVVGQDPKSGDEIKSGGTINLLISDGKGVEEVTVPDLRGKTISEAKEALSKIGLIPGTIRYDQSSTYSKDKVMDQEQSPGTKLEKGESVGFTVSTGFKSKVQLHVDYGAANQEVFYMTVTVSDGNGTRNIISNAQRTKSSGGENIEIEGSGRGTITVTFDHKTVYSKQVNFSTGEIN